MDAYLTMTTGTRAGYDFPLEKDRDNLIGRGLDCQVVLTDPLSSRVHAIVFFDDDVWWVRDAGSRNGTFLNDQKIDEVRLEQGGCLRIGSAEFGFHFGRPAVSLRDSAQPDVAQTLVLDTPISACDSTASYAVSALKDRKRAQDLLDLYQLSIGLLGCSDPDEVVRKSLELLKPRVKASVVGFLWVDDEGVLQPQLVMPEEASAEIDLSDSLTELVLKKGHAVWTNNQACENPSESLLHFADAICVPLIQGESALGALHLYLEQGRFDPSDFDIGISVANMLVIALTKARQVATLRADHERLVNNSAGFDELIGESKPILALKSRIKRVARATGCVLVRGESGCGKELIASALHRASPRADRPMLSVNCAAIPRDLMESQLFGHKKGAFTGADNDHVGWFQQADTGTLFLDEVGEMTLEGQAKLLRILEGHPFLPVGGQQEVRVDVRVIAATNRDLADVVREKRFREDLYYRLSVFELVAPPLRERGDDIRRLIQFFLDHFKLQHGRPNLTISDAALAKMLVYPWPGNVRQLRNVIDSAVVLAEVEQIQPDDLGLRDVDADALESLRFDYWERRLIKEALARTGASIPEAAKLLGIGRATLYRKVDEYGISR